MLRSALLAIHALSKMAEVESHQRFQAFLKRAVLVEPMLSRYNAVRSETDTAPSAMDIS